MKFFEKKEPLIVCILISCIVCFSIYWKVYPSSNLTQFRSSAPSYLNKRRSPESPPKHVGIFNASGSSSIDIPELQNQLLDVQQPVYVFDLQLEPHFFLHGKPLHWFGYDNDPPSVAHVKESNIVYLLRRLLKAGQLTFSQTDLKTEEEAVREAGMEYLNVLQTRRKIPHRKQVEELIRAMQSLPENCWVHFHCVGGKGRTTVAMVMFHILRNPSIPLQDIIDYHFSIGGENLFDLNVWENGTYPKSVLESRKRFITNFYTYVNDAKGLHHQSWSQWLEGRRRP